MCIRDSTEVDCTLSDGSESTCWQIITKTLPTDHDAGPWCPENVADGAEAGGIWPEDGTAHDVTGEFLSNLATFYDDAGWDMVNDDGAINRTETLEECEGAARPDVDPSLQNHCVQCLPEHIDASVENTHLIPRFPSCLLYTSPSPRDRTRSRMPSSA